MIDWKKFENPDTMLEALAEARTEFTALEAKAQELEKSNTELRDTNHKLYLKITEPLEQPHEEEEVDIDETLKSLLLGKE